MGLWVCPPLFFLGQTMLLGCWLLCYKTVFHSTATSLKPFNTHCWLVQTSSPFPLNHSHRIWPPFLRNDLRKMPPYLSCMWMCAHGHRHVCMHTQVFVYTHTYCRKGLDSPSPHPLQTWSLLRLVSMSWCKQILRRRHGAQFHKLD